MKLLILNRREVRNLLPMRTCMDILSKTFQAYSKGTSVQPLRTMMKLKNENILGSMPAYEGNSNALAVKLISIFHNEAKTNFDSHQGLVVLFSAKHGNPLAIMDAIEITALRTAAASGVATELLANHETNTLAILGSGVQARSHFLAMNEARPISSVYIWSRSLENANILAKELSDASSIEINVSKTAELAVKNANLICTVTATRKPILKGEWLTPGSHLNAVGSSSSTTREIDSEAVVKSKMFVDSRESALNEAGEFIIPASEGLINETHILGELGEVLEGEVSGRIHQDEITLFKSLGMAVEDVATAQHIYNTALKKDKGVWIDI
ncbi:MAG: ornithine cyclodeaminase family protein [Candidatus Neomarinimicrobiota bacterium]